MGEVLKLKVPASKSLTQRALLVGALAEGPVEIQDPLECADSRHLRAALTELGISIHTEPDRWILEGSLGQAAQPLWCGNAGTALRFLSALSLKVKGGITLDGNEHLRKRPVHDMGQSLQDLGMAVRYGGEVGFVPMTVKGEPPEPAHMVVDASHTSQFLSGLLMVGPTLPGGLSITLKGGLVSRPYLDLTRDVMEQFGASFEQKSDRAFVVPADLYRPASYPVEGDWSGAAMVLAASWITKKEVVIENLAPASNQGDRVFTDFLKGLDRKEACTFDLHDCPDLISPLAVAAVFADGPVEIVHVAHARIKECDRVAVLAAELSKAGVRIEERPDGLSIRQGGNLKPCVMDPAEDHRMAMAFGILSLKVPGIEVIDPECVDKSYPDFWQVLERFR